MIVNISRSARLTQFVRRRAVEWNSQQVWPRCERIGPHQEQSLIARREAVLDGPVHLRAPRKQNRRAIHTPDVLIRGAPDGARQGTADRLRWRTREDCALFDRVMN